MGPSGNARHGGHCSMPFNAAQEIKVSDDRVLGGSETRSSDFLSVETASDRHAAES